MRVVVPPALAGDLGAAIAEHRTDAAVAQGLDGGVGVLRRVLNVRPIEYGRHTGVERTQRGDQIAGVHVLRATQGAEAAQNCLEVVAQRAVGQRVAKHAFPEVPMRIDEARHHDRVGGVDHLRIGRRQIGPDGRDPGTIDQNVAFRQLTGSGMHGEDRSALEEHPAASSSSSAVGCVRGRVERRRRAKSGSQHSNHAAA